MLYRKVGLESLGRPHDEATLGARFDMPAVLAGFIRSGEPLVVTSPATGIPAGSGQTRRYHTLEALKKGVSNARVFAGVHFRKSNEVGADIGAKVGRWVLQRSLKPTKPS